MPEMIPVAQATRLLKLSDERLRQLASQGHIPKAVKGMYPLVGIVHGYIDFLKDEERRSSKSAAASAVQAARAKEIEMRIARESGKLIEMEDIEAMFSEWMSVFRSDLSGIPAAVTRDLALREKIETAINDAIGRLRNSLEKWRYSKRSAA